MRNLPPRQIQRMLADGQDMFMLDVREPWEFATCRIETSINIPMNRIPSALATLDPGRETLVICHHGARSMQVADYLESAGFANVINLQGGIDAWAKSVDPGMSQY